MKRSSLLSAVAFFLLIAVYFAFQSARSSDTSDTVTNVTSEILSSSAEQRQLVLVDERDAVSAQSKTANAVTTKATNAQGQSQEALSTLTSGEQQSLWQAFSEAQRNVYPIPEAWAQRSENLGFDFYALHPKQNLTARFGSQGVQFVSSDRTYTEEDASQPETAWTAQMHVLSLAGQRIPLGVSAVKPEGASGRVEYYHLPWLTEWYDNGATAMEHGYTIEQRPAHLDTGEDVTIEVALSGLKAAAHTSEDGSHQLNFVDGERTVLSYSKLLVIDAEGKELPATMTATDAGFTLAYNDTAATYPVIVDPLIVNEEAKLNRINAVAYDNFGRSVAISGDTVVVGAIGDDVGAFGYDAGSAYVFTRDVDGWSLQGKLTADDAAGGDNFGISVAISGDSVVVGAYHDDDGGSSSGSAYVFTRSGSVWSQQAKLTAGDAAANDEFGYSVAISSDTVIVGALNNDDNGSNSGSAYVFTRSGNVWSQQAKLTANDAAADDNFGNSVAISSDSVVVGAYGDESFTGSTYVFTRSGNVWSQQDKLTASDGATGNSFGCSVGISGEYVIVGSYFDANDITNAGCAFIYVRSGSTWSEQDKLIANDAEGYDFFGASVAISGDSVVVGAANDDDGGSSSGGAYVFTRSGSTWTQQDKLTAGDAAANDLFGDSVAISGDSVIVGAYLNDIVDTDSGSAYVYTRSGSTWSQQAMLIKGDAAAGDSFGQSVAIFGDTVVVGAYTDDDGGFNSGSAYILTRSGDTWSQQAKLIAEDADSSDLFGRSVALSGDTAVVGAYGNDDDGSESGSVYVFARSGTAWSQQTKLTADDAATDDSFGLSVAISGNTLVVGAYKDDDNGSNSGSAYVYHRSGSAWMQQAKLTAADAEAGDAFGWEVAISGDSVVVGAFADNGYSGSAYVFIRSGHVWSQQAKLTTETVGGFFGHAVAISGDYIVVGALNSDNVGSTYSGNAYVFTRSGNVWSQQAKLTADDAADYDNFGKSVAISGGTVVVGAFQDDHGGFNNNGSAYVFTRSGSTWSQQEKITANDSDDDDIFGYSVVISGDSVVVGAIGEGDGDAFFGSVYIYRIAVPSVRVLQAFDYLGVELQDGGASAAFPAVQLGESGDFTFRLGNAGELDLDIQSVTLGGANSAQFSLTLPDISSSSDLVINTSLDYTISFNPSGSVSGLRSALVLVTSNDTNTPVYSFTISGLGLSATADEDGDGMNDWPEYALRGFGFDWEQAQPNLVNDYYDLASTAGLYTPEEAAGLNANFVLSDVDLSTNTAIITIGLEESLDLQGFDPITLNPSELSVDGDGKIRVEVEAPAGKKFYRAGFAP